MNQALLLLAPSLLSTLPLLSYGSEISSNVIDSDAWSYYYCDEEYNISSCANTTLTGSYRYKCRGFLSCKDSTVDTSYDLFCQGDRACKNVIYDNNDDDELWAYGYQSADSLVMYDEAHTAYCYGYQSCIDLTYAESSNTGNDVYAHGYQGAKSTYIDYSDTVTSYGYEGLYSTIINTTDVSGDTITISVNGYYGSYDVDVYCQDGMTCNFYAYGYYATYDTYIYCLSGASCNVYCGETNGCSGLNLLCYSTATCYFDCDDATSCPEEEDAQASAKLMNYIDGHTAQDYDNKFDQIAKERLEKKLLTKHINKNLRDEEDRIRLNEMKYQQFIEKTKSVIIEWSIVLCVGIFIGVMATRSYSKYINNKEYQYQSIQ